MFSATKTSTAGTEVTFAEKYCFPVLVNTPAAIARQEIHFLCFDSTTVKIGNTPIKERALSP